MLRRWGARLTMDPQYNPNLGLVIPDFTVNPDVQIDWSRPAASR
jgi:hypothetical protein